MKRYPLIDKIRYYDAVVLANGDFPKASPALDLLHNASFVCACDGAAVNYPQADVIIGDGDSVSEELKSRIILVDEQEDNDLTKATRYCLSKGLKRIVYLGASGGREDHTIGNFSLMARYTLEMGVEPLLATDYGWLVVANGLSTFESFKFQQVSIFNIDCHSLSSDNLHWHTYPYTQLWQGTLNEATGDSFLLKADGHYMVYRSYLPK